MINSEVVSSRDITNQGGWKWRASCRNRRKSMKIEKMCGKDKDIATLRRF